MTIQTAHSILIGSLVVGYFCTVFALRTAQKLAARSARDIERLELAVAALIHERDCRTQPGPDAPATWGGRMVRIGPASSPEDLAQKVSDAIKVEMLRRREGM